MPELIGIREAARRIGVSDTAIQKAIKAGRVQIAGRTETSNRPLVAWPNVKDDYLNNTDVAKRSHVGPQPGSPRAAQEAKQPPRVALGDNSTMGEPAPEKKRAAAAAAAQPLPAPKHKTPAVPLPPADTGGNDAPAKGGPNYAQSRAIREAYAARLLKLEHDEKVGKLVAIDAVHAEAFKAHRTIRDALMNMPDQIAPDLAVMDDPVEIQIFLSNEINKLLRKLSADIYNEKTA